MAIKYGTWREAREEVFPGSVWLLTHKFNYRTILEYWYEADAANNRTTVRVTLKLQTGAFTQDPEYGTWSVHPTEMYMNSSSFIEISGTHYNGWLGRVTPNQTYTMIDASKVINHNADGSAPQQFIGGNFYASTRYFAEYQFSYRNVFGGTWLEGVLPLPKYDRPAKLLTAPAFNDEDNPTITYSNPAGNAVTSLQACIAVEGTLNTADIEYRDVNKTGTSYTFNLTEEERQLLREATTTLKEKTVKFYLKTVIGGTTYYSTLDRTLSIVNAEPTFNEFDYFIQSPHSFTTVEPPLIMGISSLIVGVSPEQQMQTKKSATPLKYIAYVGGVNQELIENSSGIYTTTFADSIPVGTHELEVRAYDSRNNFSSKKYSVVCEEYKKPTTALTAKRLNDFENETTLTIKGTYTTLPIVSGNRIDNEPSNKYKYRTANGEWTEFFDATTITDGATQYTCNDIFLNLYNKETHEILVETSDALNTITTTIIVNEGIPIFFISDNKRAIGVNCLPPEEAEPGSVWCNNQPLLDMFYPVGTIYETTSTDLDTTTKMDNYFGGTWETYGDGRVLVAKSEDTEFNAIGKTGGDKNTESHSHQVKSFVVGSDALGYGGWQADIARAPGGSGGPYLASARTNSFGIGESGNLQPYIVVYRYRRIA